MAILITIFTLIFIWWVCACYLGIKSANLIALIIIAIIVVILNWFNDQPTEQELKFDKEHRRSIGQ